jgi:hypothetical protein
MEVVNTTSTTTIPSVMARVTGVRLLVPFGADILLIPQIGCAGFGFCTDYEDQGFIYLAGPGELGDMDVDWQALDVYL